MVDRQVVQRARRGDPAAFDVLVDATIGRLDGAARLILRDADAASDAVQEAYARAWRDLPALRDPDRFEAWLHRLLVRACYDELRRQRRSPIQYTINPDGTGLRAVTDLDADRIRATQPRWMSSGAALLYTLVTPNPNDEYGDRHIWQMRFDGGQPQMTAGGLVGSHPEPRPMP